MKKTINLIIGVVFIAMTLSCNQKHTKQNDTISNAKLEVFYFHSSFRCPTCKAVENLAKKTLDENYKTELNNGTIKFASYNVDEEVNKALVEKYEISFSTLLFIKADGTKIDFTNTAFQYANTDPVKYAELLKIEIDRNLK